MAESEHLKCSNCPPSIKSSRNHSHRMWVVDHFFVTEDEAQFFCLVATISHFHQAASALADQLSSSLLLCHNTLRSLNVLARALSWGSSELCRQPEDLEGVEGGGEGDLLGGLVQVGRYHLHRHRQRARLVSLETRRE